MGYYTRYTLKVISGNEMLTEDASKMSDSAGFAINANGNARQSSCWYDHEKEMKKLSRKHPETLFELRGEGEETSDMWIKYFQGGKMQVCKATISFEPFDPNKLQ